MRPENKFVLFISVHTMPRIKFTYFKFLTKYDFNFNAAIRKSECDVGKKVDRICV